MSEDKFREIIRSRLTEQDVNELFHSTLVPLATEIAKQLTSSITSAAKRGKNIYDEQYGDLFALPIGHDDVMKLVMSKVVEQYNAMPDRLFDITLTEREG